MFRGKESSNRIEFWCFGLPVALHRGQVGGEVSRDILGYGGVPTCTHMHTHGGTHV